MRGLPEPRVLIPLILSARSLVDRIGEGSVFAFGGETMGTSWSVRVVARAEPDGLAAMIQAVLDAIVAQMSPWEPGSDISRFNRASGGSWHGLPSDFFHVLTSGLAIAARSGGAFDPSAGALVDLWGFGPPGPRAAPPRATEIAAARAACGWHRVVIDRAARRALQPGGVVLDLSGIAKGFAVDRITELLLARGHAHFLVEVGGELRGQGVKPDGQPWWVVLERLPGAALGETRVALHGLACATSGDYRRVFEHDGHRYAHSIDPRTGWPADNALASVTVLHSSGMMADALATAIIVLGRDEGLALAVRDDIAVLLVERRGDGFVEHLSPAMRRMLE